MVAALLNGNKATCHCFARLTAWLLSIKMLLLEFMYYACIAYTNPKEEPVQVFLPKLAFFLPKFINKLPRYFSLMILFSLSPQPAYLPTSFFIPLRGWPFASSSIPSATFAGNMPPLEITAARRGASAPDMIIILKAGSL